MQEQDKHRFSEVMTGLAENFGDSLSRPGLKMRFETLKEYSIEQIEQAAFDIMRHRKYTKMPTVAEFLEFLGGGSSEDQAQVQATNVLSAIKQHGPYNSVVFDDATTQAVLEQGFGGWQKLCEELTGDNEKWFIKDFSRMYTAFKKQGVKQYGRMLGITEHQNLVDGEKKHIPEPIYIGDTSKAKQIAGSGSRTKTLQSITEMCSTLRQKGGGDGNKHTASPSLDEEKG